MKLLWLSALLAVAALPASTRVEAKPNFISQYTRLTGCNEVAHGDLEQGEDWVYFRCKGFDSIPVWYECQDSARCKLGFGTKPNASGVFEARSFLSWPKIEWRGTVQQGHFKPFAVILRGRLYGLEETTNTLTVFRLRLDGTSCIVGEASTNTTARRIADNAANDYQCENEPELL